MGDSSTDADRTFSGFLTQESRENIIYYKNSIQKEK